MKHHRRRRPPRTPRTSPSVLERIQVDVAGIDCGAAEHFVSVPPDRDPTPVQSFRTFTADLERLADWLLACGITSVAMEATGVYWIPVYDILEARGLEVLLVNARHVKHVPGRKSDVQDCEWLRELHSVGLLRGSFRPAAAILALRAVLRHRDTLVKNAGTYVQRMQKGLVEMNLLLPRVVSDIVGKTGLTILRALVAGERDPHVLAQHRDSHCKASVDEIAAALTGHYRDEHVFVLQQNLELFDMCQAQLAACDTTIEAQLETLTATAETPPTALPRARVTRRHGNEPAFDIRTPLHQLTGADLTQIDGIAPYTALKLLSEIGTDLTRWPTERHFTAWLTLAPQNKVSGGRRPQLPHPTIRQSRGRHAPDRRPQPRPGSDRARRFLPPVGRPHRQAQGPHRHRAQARHPRLSHPPRHPHLSRPRRPHLQRPPTGPPPTPPTDTRRDARVHTGQPRNRRGTGGNSFLGGAEAGADV